MTIADEIERLHELHQSGALTDAEFAQAKAKILAHYDTAQETQRSFQRANEQSFSQPVHEMQINYFRRSKTDQWLGGICGGLAKLTGIESWILRLLFVLFSLYFGSGVILYVLAWIFVPEEE